MTEEEQWAANQEFLDEAIARGDTFQLSSPPEDAQPGTGYYKEIEYLLNNGYVQEGEAFVPSINAMADLFPIPIPLPPPGYWKRNCGERDRSSSCRHERRECCL